MKKQFLMTIAAAILSMAMVSAQGGMQRKSPEERTKETMEKLAVLNLDQTAKAKTDSVFSVFYKAQTKMFEEAMAGGGQVDREAMRSQRQKLADERDTQLKVIFTAEQFKKWKDEIEPSMRPQRGNRGQ
jgi:periplasmic protein CpxP/Spy